MRTECGTQLLIREHYTKVLDKIVIESLFLMAAEQSRNGEYRKGTGCQTFLGQKTSMIAARPTEYTGTSSRARRPRAISNACETIVILIQH